MTNDPPFRFAVVLDGDVTATELREVARSAEDLGYAMLLCSDHLHNRLAALPICLAALEATTTLEVATYVINCDLRNADVLARDLWSIHQLGGGRLTVGLGAGWLASDYEAADADFDDGATRLRRFTLAVHRIREYLDASAADSATPRRPPLLIGGARRHMLEFAARNADIVSVMPARVGVAALTASDATPEGFDHKHRWISDAQCDRAVPPEINHVCWECFVTPRPRDLIATLASVMGVPEDVVTRIPFMLLGSVGQIVEELLRRRSRWGASLIAVPAGAMRDFAPVVRDLDGR